MEEFRERIRSRVEFNLTHALGQISKAYELMELKSNAPIVENIIYLGMLRKTEQILKGRSCKEIEKSI
jgi:transcription initiation factor TFIIIB Brf1 subunit/transcription initiation factor TFIIB